MATHAYLRAREPSAIAARAELLLSRYPNLSEAELAELINLMHRLPVLDLGLMTADDRLSDQLDAFHRDHGDKLGPSLISMAFFLIVPTALGVGTVWWLLS